MMESSKRRQFFRFVLGASLVASSAALLKSILWPAALDADEVTALERFADALLPAGELPPASSLGVPRALVETALTDRQLRRLLHRGLSWLASTSRHDFGRPFTELSDTERGQVLAIAAAAKDGTVERIFFDRARLELCTLYYAHPQTWVGLPASFPPQPMGFLDFASPSRG
jgi:gluconate 2-dehydrogenase subunit 3-like protein